MTIRALLLLCGVSLALAGAASAQSVSPPAAASTPPAAADAPAAPAALPPPASSAPPESAPSASSRPGVPPQRLRAMVRASGFDPIGPPVRRGDLLVQRAIGPNDIEYRLVLDPLTGRTVSVRPMRVAGPYGGPAYGPRPYFPPPYRPAYGRYWGPPADYGFSGAPRPPRAVSTATAHLAPPQSEPQHQLPPSAAAQPSTQAPLPRPKPYVMEATGSIPADSPQPLPAQKTAERQTPAAPPARVHPDNGAAAMPPIAPLD